MSARRLCSASCVVVICLLAACGGASSPAFTGTSGGVDNSARGGGEKLPVTTCIDAEVRAGRGGAEARFAVTCRAAARGGRVRFSVGRRYIGHFSQHPSVRGPGAERHYGSCTRRLKEIVDCQSRVDGRVTITGMIEVDPKTRCSEAISVTVIEPSECNRGACPEGAVVRQLFKGLPAGC